MNWGKVLGGAVKAALIFGAAGALLSLAAPGLGAMAGLTEVGALANVGFQAAFFASFGALSSVITSVVSNALGEKEEAKHPEPKHHKPRHHDKGLTVVNVTVASPAVQHHGHHVTVNNPDIDVKQDVAVIAVDASEHNKVNVDASQHTKHTDKFVKNVIKHSQEAALASDNTPAHFAATEENRRASRESILLGASQRIH